MVKAGSEVLALKIASDLQELVAWVIISIQLIAAYNIEFGLLWLCDAEIFLHYTDYQSIVVPHI